MINSQGIDVAATREKLRGKGYSITGFARANGIDPATFGTRFHNGVKFKPKEVEALRESGLLVEAA